MNKTVYLLNEVKATETLRSTTTVNVVRDRGNRKCFTAAAFNQPLDSEAIVIVFRHKFEVERVEIPGGQYSFFTKTSEAIKLVQLLYNRGVQHIKVYNYRNDADRELTEIVQGDDIYKKIDDICGIATKETNYMKYVGCKRVAPTIQKAESFSFSASELKELDIPVPTPKLIEKFKKYAEVYGLDSNKKADFITYLWIMTHSEDRSEFITGDRFICPCCGHVVKINNTEEYINGKYINTGKTTCENCYEEFDVHDKNDIINLNK